MSDLLASTILLPLTPAIPARAAPVKAPVTADFMAMLGELVLGSGGKHQGGKGQALAADGKILPVMGEGGAEDEADPAIAWLPAGMLPLHQIEAEPSQHEALVETSPAPSEMSTAIPPADEMARASAAVAEPVLSEDGGVVRSQTPIDDSETKLNGKAEAPVRESVATPIIPGTGSQSEAQVSTTAISASFESSSVPSPRADAVVPNRILAAEQLRTTAQIVSGAEMWPLDLSRGEAPVRERPSRPVRAPVITPMIPGTASRSERQATAIAISASFEFSAPAASRADRAFVSNQTAAEQQPLDLSRGDRAGKPAIFVEPVLLSTATPHGGKGQELELLPSQGEGRVDPAIARLPAGSVPLQPIAPAPPTGGASRTAQPAAIEGLAALPEAGPAFAGAGSVSVPVAKPAAIVVDSEAGPAAMPAVATETVPDMKTEGAMREQPQRPAPAPVVTPQLVVPGAPVAQTAAQVFAAAISASFDSAAAPAPHAEAVIVQNQTAATGQLRTMVQALSGAEQPPLDLSRDDWAGKMVDRIAALRDAAEAADTRIRLAPENLGTVDVSIRRDGDRLHVHFTAETAATRQLLAEAAPRLAELADARGVKLGQTSVDAGAGGQQGSRDQSETSQPARPTSTVIGAPETDHDDRVA